MIHVKKILYPTDFSSYSNQAYFHAIALAENHRASLTVLYVYSSVDGKDHGERQHWREHGKRIVEQALCEPAHGRVSEQCNRNRAW